MGYPQALRIKPTGPTEIVPYTNPFATDSTASTKDIQPRPLDEVSPLLVDAVIQSNWPVYPPDGRLILWELQRGYVGETTSHDFHKKNRYVVPYSKPISSVFRSNTALLILGSQEQVKAAMYYIMDYMTKDATALTNVISLVHEARLQTIKYKSQAAHSNTQQRNAIQFLTCINNKLAAKFEISCVMAAAAIMVMKSKASINGQYTSIQQFI
jgi:hypothetical protein